jgi:thymidylate synthase ThyX
MLTQQRQSLNPYLGFTIPEDIVAIGMDGQVREVEKLARHLYEKIEKSLGPDVAQYGVLFGHHIRFLMGFNLREAQHLLELRTIPQGHPDYRRICQKMDSLLKQKAPWLKEIGLLQFVDYADYPWARAEAEARQSAKRLQAEIT